LPMVGIAEGTPDGIGTDFGIPTVGIAEEGTPDG
jgi:hypothetical protein